MPPRERPVRKRACAGKRCYRDYDHAKYDAIILRRRGTRHVSAYLCQYCDSWHVGRTPYWLRRGYIGEDAPA